MKNDKDIPITRAVGRFFGHLWNATTKPVEKDSESTIVSQKTEESDTQINGKQVTLRRTTIEEIEVHDQS
ncbi:MAG: hypothetical protein JJ974_08680 [Phycisphaerales bacterium]|nr:hypothetical protein [Phycisphaerales bacterium]